MGFIEIVFLAGRVLAVMAVTFGLVTLLASLLRFHLLTTRVQQDSKRDVDPEDLFQLRLMQQLGSFRQAPAPFAILLIAPNIKEGASEGPEDRADAMNALLAWVIGQLRADDFGVLYEDRMIGVLVPATDAARAWPLAQRLLEEAAKPATRVGALAMPYPSLSIGMAAFPENGQRAADLLSAARSALKTAQTAGGTGIEHAAVPTPVSTPEDDEKSPILDELTGLLKANRLGTTMQKYVARHRKENRPVSAIYLSIDFFKQYQDHYTEQSIELILKGLADVLSRSTRQSDLLARADESEFLVVLVARPQQALGVAQRLSAEIKRTPIQTPQSSLKITVSAGVAGFPDHSGQARQMYEYAEAAMAAARERGRNISLMYQPSMKARTPDHRPVDAF